MSDTVLQSITFCCALGCGLAAGVFFAFSSFVMRALGRLTPPQGIVAMQSINVVAVTPMFMAALFGTALLCLVLAVMSIIGWQKPGTGLQLGGCAIYLVGCIGVTIAFNVPLNNALAAVDPAGDEGARLWARYLIDWGMWNHVRTVACLLAAALLTAAFYLHRNPSPVVN